MNVQWPRGLAPSAVQIAIFYSSSTRSNRAGELFKQQKVVRLFNLNNEFRVCL